MRSRKLTCPYERRVYIRFGTLKQIRAKLEDWPAGQTAQFEKQDDGDNGPLRFVTCVTSEGRARTIAYLAHEILHLTFDVLGDMGLKHCSDSEEAYTYYFQVMLSQAL